MTKLKDLLSPPTQKLTGRKLYHYTTQEGLLGIVKNRSLWTTSILHLNDSTEFNYAFSLVRRKLALKVSKGDTESFYQRALGYLGEVSAQKGSTVYVGSFSEDGDSLSQWRGYTNNGIGFSVGFREADLQSLASKQNYRLVKCVYDENEQDEIISRLIKETEALLVTGSLVKAFAKAFATPLSWPIAVTTELTAELPAFLRFYLKLLEIASLLKHPSFQDEKEWRVVGKFRALGEDSKFRAGKSMLIPYREFNLENEGHELGVAEIFVGPTPHVELAKASVKQLVECKKTLNPEDVRVSKVPFRAW
jgi:hypothetical protein